MAWEDLTLSIHPNSWSMSPPPLWPEMREQGSHLQHWKLQRQLCLCRVLPSHCLHWSAFNKDDLIGWHTQLVWIWSLVNIIRISLHLNQEHVWLVSSMMGKAGSWRASANHLFCPSLENPIRRDRFQVLRAEPALAVRVAFPVECFC